MDPSHQKSQKVVEDITQITRADDVQRFRQYVHHCESRYCGIIYHKVFDESSTNIIKHMLGIIQDSEDQKSQLELFQDFMYSVSPGSIELIQLFEQRGARYDCLLPSAFYSRNLDLIDWILENCKSPYLDHVLLMDFSKMELVKFFYERKIFTGQLKEVLTYCSFEDMKYILENYISFDQRSFLEIFSQGSPDAKPELVEYILKTYEVDVQGEKGFDLMRFAFNKGHIELIKYLLDKDVMLYRKNLNAREENTMIEDENQEDEEEKETKLYLGASSFYNVMDKATHTNIEAYKLILERGGKANAKGVGMKNSLLDYHAMKGNFEIVKILVEHQAQISINTFCR